MGIANGFSPLTLQTQFPIQSSIRPTRITIMNNPNHLNATLDSLFDYLYGNSPVRTPIAIWNEIHKVLQTAIFIEQSTGVAPAFRFTKSDLTKLNRLDTSITAFVASRVRNNYARMKKQRACDPADPLILLDDQNIATICAALSGLALSSLDIDVLGESLEVFRHNWTKRNGGQFFTDPAITSLAIQMLEFNPFQGDDLVDIAAGTGGFLLAGANHIKHSLLDATQPPTYPTQPFASVVKKAIKGIEIDESLANIANGTLSSRIGQDDVRLVAVGDSLNSTDATPFVAAGVKDDAHLCAATNPPFGTKITVKDPAILTAYETPRLHHHIQAKPTLSAQPSPTSLDVLFLERNIQILKPGSGRLAIVLPYQLMSGPQAFAIRHWVLRHAVLEAVVDLPAETFQPYTGTKTCLVLLRRRPMPLNDLGSTHGEQVFMSVPKWIGHDRRGKPVFQTSKSGGVTEEILSDIGDVATAFRAFRNGGNPSREHPESFAVPIRRVLDDDQLRFNARYFRPSHLLDAIAALPASRSWRTLRLKDVTDDIFFPGRFRRQYVDESQEAVPFLGGTNISQLVPIIDKWLSKDDPKVEDLRVSAGWILVTRSGSTGIVSSVPPHWDGWAISEHVIRIVPNRDLLDPNYLEAYLRSKFAKASIHRGVFGSVIDEITPEFLGEIEIPIPISREVQNHIANTAKAAQIAREQAIQLIHQAVDAVEDAIETSPREKRP